jgi:hypothetical protein
VRRELLSSNNIIEKEGNKMEHLSSRKMDEQVNHIEHVIISSIDLIGAYLDLIDEGIECKYCESNRSIYFPKLHLSIDQQLNLVRRD